MSTTSLMQLGIRAMAANYAALQTTGHNIGNATVQGYSRQRVELATAEGQYSGAGFFGRGVNVQAVTRAHNEFLTRESASATALSGMDSARLTQLRRLENVFQPGSGGLGAAAQELFASMVDLSSQPADLATREVVLARAADLAARFNEAGTALDDAQAGVTSDLKAAVADVNQLARSIAHINDRIAGLRGTGQPPNDLLDERERLIGRLAQQVQVTRVEASDGSLGLFIGGGQRLVLGSQAVQLQVVPDAQDPSRSAVALREDGATRTMTPDAIGGGAVAGLLRFQNSDLVQGRNLVGRLAASVAGAVNGQQQRGLNLQAPAGSVASQPMFAIGPPQALANAGNARDASGALLGSVALTVADPAALKASDYDLRPSTSSPGSWQLTRLADGAVSTVNSGDVVDGLRIDIGNAQEGDRFVLQPVARAAGGMTALLDDPRDVAAASALVATPAAGNGGTGKVTALQVDSAPLPFPGASDTLTFNRLNPAVDGYDYTVTSSLTGAMVPWRTGLPVPGGNGYTLQMSGVPADGDSISVLPTPASAVSSNNGNALSLAALRDAALVDGRSATDGWAQALADVGVRVQSGQTASDISTAVAAQVSQANSSETGVNLDEEAARLIQYQQSYQAAAKVLQVAQSLFDTLLQAAAR